MIEEKSRAMKDISVLPSEPLLGRKGVTMYEYLEALGKRFDFQVPSHAVDAWLKRLWVTDAKWYTARGSQYRWQDLKLEIQTRFMENPQHQPTVSVEQMERHLTDVEKELKLRHGVRIMRIRAKLQALTL
jgi:hypothetical protein